MRKGYAGDGEGGADDGAVADTYKIQTDLLCGGATMQSNQEVQMIIDAAEMGVPEMQNTLGALHANGDGVPMSMEKAAHWYRKAAEQGHAMAQCNLGVVYLKGLGVEKNQTIAAGDLCAILIL